MSNTQLVADKGYGEAGNEKMLIDVQSDVINVTLRADPTVIGSLAFRLIGSRTNGVFIYSLNKESHQAEILDDGDKLLYCNEISLKGLTCEQVANILRLSLFRNGTLRLIIYREINIKERLKERKSSMATPLEQEEEQEEWQAPQVTKSQSAFAIPTLPSANEPFAMRDFVRSATVLRKHSKPRSEDCIKLISTDYSETIRKKETRNYYCFDEDSVEVDIADGRYRCPICLKYTRLRRLHMLKHEWFTSARRLLPASASEFIFDVNRETFEYAAL